VTDAESGDDDKDGLINEEVNRDTTDEADEMNLEVDSTACRDHKSKTSASVRRTSTNAGVQLILCATTPRPLFNGNYFISVADCIYTCI